MSNWVSFPNFRVFQILTLYRLSIAIQKDVRTGSTLQAEKVCGRSPMVRRQLHLAGLADSL